MFNDKADNRHLSMLFKMSKDEKDFLIQEAKRRGTSIVALLRKCIREKLVLRKQKNIREKLVPRKQKNHVESRT